MAQKITLTLASVATLACIVLCVLMWRGIETMQALVDSTQQVNAALAEQLAALASQSSSVEQPVLVDPEVTTQLRVTCVYDSVNGPPAIDALVRLQSLPKFNSESYALHSRRVGTDSLAVFDHVPLGVGHLSLEVITEAGHVLKRTIDCESSETELTIVCPRDLPTGEATIHLDFTGIRFPAADFPDGRQENIGLLCLIQQPLFTDFVSGEVTSAYGGTEWQGERWWLNSSRLILVNREGAFYEIDPHEIYEESLQLSTSNISVDGRALTQSTTQRHLAETIEIDQNVIFSKTLELPIGEYIIDTEFLVRHPTEEEGPQIWKPTERSFSFSGSSKTSPLRVQTGDRTEWNIWPSEELNPVDKTLSPAINLSELLIQGQKPSKFGGGVFGGGGGFF